MKVRQTDLGKVLLSVLNDLQIRPGRVVTMGTLMDAWTKVGLRRDDLHTALSQLLDEDWIEIEEEPDAPQCLVLTEAGHKKVLASASALSLIASSAQRLRRTSERRRQKTKAKGKVGEIPHEERRSRDD